VADAPKLADIVELLATVHRYRAEVAERGGAVDAATIAVGDALVELVTTHFPDPTDRAAAGVAVMLAAGFASVCADREIPAQVIGAALGSAAGRLIEGG
jgi:hypothetical protein